MEITDKKSLNFEKESKVSKNGSGLKAANRTTGKVVPPVSHDPENVRQVMPEDADKEKEEPQAEPEVKPDKPEGENSINFAPKTFLQPYMLLLLRDWSMHGYEVWERLMKMGFPGFDQNDRATVYRALRQLEREGKVKSEWDTNTEGPARRVYSLTEAGEEFLKVWAKGLDQYRQTLDFFFKLYTGGMVPSPFSFSPFKDSKRNDKNNK